MSDISKFIYNNRERLTSTDLNNNNLAQNFALQEALQAAMSPDNRESGVISGLNVTVNAVAKTVTVSAGIALLNEPTNTYPESKAEWIQVLDPITTSLPAATGFDHWAVVEITPGTQTLTSPVRDTWDPTIPPSGNFTSGTVPKDIRSLPVVSIRAGADGSPSAPSFQSGTSGVMPLAFVFVDAAGVVTAGIDGMVSCRPILRTPSAFDVQTPAFTTAISSRSHGQVRGGGLIQPTASQTDCNTSKGIVGNFPGSSIGFLINNHLISNVATDVWEGGNVPAADSTVYAWTAPPPYPPGYSAVLANREFSVGSAVESKFATASAANANCIVFLSTLAPNTAAGPTGAQNGVGTIADRPFRVGGSAVNSDRESWIYIGAIDYDVSQPAFMAQATEGARIILRERSPHINFKEKGNGVFVLSSSQFTGSPATNLLGFLPTYAKEVAGVFQATIDTGAKIEIRILDKETEIGFAGKRYIEYDIDSTTPTIEWYQRLSVAATANFTVTPAPAGLTVAPLWISRSYVDPFLLER